ncbi:MAG: oligosaccharide flippase family protein [Oscillospiraceae bacterium]|nr:oligosaccharide flippase family protein [Oscillospiraceae bacterium]
MKMRGQTALDFPMDSYLPKILCLIMIRLYTGCLGPAELSLVTKLQYFVCVLGLVATLGVSEAVIDIIRKDPKRKSEVYTTSVVFSLVTLIIILCLFPLLSKAFKFSKYVSYVILMLFAVRFRDINRQYARANNLSRICFADNIINIILTAAFMVIFILLLELGVKGYFIAAILADICSSIFIMALSDLKSQLNPDNIDMKLARKMVRISAPYVGAALCWWMMRYINFYLVSYLVSNKESGMYICAYLVSDMIMLAVIMLRKTWTDDMFAFEDKKIIKSHYTKALDSYFSILTAAAAIIMLLVKVVMSILTDKAYWEAYRFAPFIIVAMVIQSMCYFLSCIYFEKNIVRTFIKCAALAVIMNIIFDIILIPFLDAQGASISALISSFILFIMVIVDTQRIMKYSISWRKIGLNLITLIYMSVVIVFKLPVMYVWLLIGVIVIALINYPALTASVSLYAQNKNSGSN